MPKIIAAYGEIMMRLSPINQELLQHSNRFDAFYGGSEANVLIALSHLGHTTRFLTRLPSHDLGQGAVEHLCRHGVDTRFIQRDPVHRLGTYYFETGFGNRPSKVIYDRKEAAINYFILDNLDLDAFFEDVAIFHTSGISSVISPHSREVTLFLLKEAQKRGILTSFDFNYRSSLMDIESASLIYRELMPFVDIAFMSDFDAKNLLKLDSAHPLESVFAHFPTQWICTMQRTVLSSQENTLKAVFRTRDGEQYATEAKSFPILDRVGSGDAFDAGIIDYLLNHEKGNKDYHSCVHFALSMAILKHTLPGDVFFLDRKTVEDSVEKRDISR